MNEIEDSYRELLDAAGKLAQSSSLQSLLKTVRLSELDESIIGPGRITNGLTSLINIPLQQAQTASSGTVSAGNIKSAAQAIVAGTVRNLASGLTLGPIFSWFAGLLFGDKRDEADEVELSKYVPSKSIHFTGAMPTRAGMPVLGIDYDQSGLPRLLATAPLGPLTERTSSGTAGADGAQAKQGITYAPSITVQVQALDSRSFLEHSDEIARAVREALLNSHSLGDVLGEL